MKGAKVKQGVLLEWKGVNDQGKPVIAKIRQELNIQINKDKSWSVVSIKEKHLLPDIFDLDLQRSWRWLKTDST